MKFEKLLEMAFQNEEKSKRFLCYDSGSGVEIINQGDQNAKFKNKCKYNCATYGIVKHLLNFVLY